MLRVEDMPLVVLIIGAVHWIGAVAAVGDGGTLSAAWVVFNVAVLGNLAGPRSALTGPHPVFVPVAVDGVWAFICMGNRTAAHLNEARFRHVAGAMMTADGGLDVARVSQQ